ncbi:protein abrupt-like isoform X1 [Chironomus tepperi]|uniref:protein abrupt-like isoform X1 n=1 Tax=Chironomus tepperi TaxID=113505 RepID=UPI00391EE21B
MAGSELFYLKWNNFTKNVRRMRDEEDLVDITFACEGKKLGAHKLVLYSCSPYFKELLKDNKSSHPIFFFHDISFDILKAILEYMYLGEVHITNENLKDFIRVAEALQIRGLSKDTATTEEDEEFIRKRASEEHHLQSYTHGKKLKIMNEALTAALNDDDDMENDDMQSIRAQQQQHNTRKENAHNVQPKTESLEFLEDVQNIQAQQAMVKQPQNITYMSMDSFSAKANTVNPTHQQQHGQSQFIQAGTSQSHHQQPAHPVEYKSEDEIWVEKAIDIASNSGQQSDDTSPKSTKSSKNNAAYKANCLTPRLSCPVCARVYSNVSNLRQHMRLIHNPQAVVCPICQKHFNSDLYLKRHYASIHSLNTSNASETDEKPSTNPANNTGSTNWSYNDPSILQQ